MPYKMFVNLPVKNLKKTVEFFTTLGFTFNPKFTNEKGTCMIVGNEIGVMLLDEKFFKSFTKKEICDSNKCAETILAVSVENREKVDEMIKKVVKSGGSEPKAPQDYGYMYGRSFQDIDGHLWEVFYMNESAADQPEETVAESEVNS